MKTVLKVEFCTFTDEIFIHYVSHKYRFSKAGHPLQYIKYFNIGQSLSSFEDDENCKKSEIISYLFK